METMLSQCVMIGGDRKHAGLVRENSHLDCKREGNALERNPAGLLSDAAAKPEPCSRQRSEWIVTAWPFWQKAIKRHWWSADCRVDFESKAPSSNQFSVIVLFIVLFCFSGCLTD